MSNDEALLVQGSERSCIDEAHAAGVELLLPREVPLGGPRALPVLRSLPNKHRHMIGAWCFADSFGPTDLGDGPGMDVPPHPHTGLQTVSWLVEGAIAHTDSTGARHTVRPGGVNVMTAGRGISHSEYSTPDTTVLHGVQLWTVLPLDQHAIDPSFAGLDEVPSATLPGGAVMRVFVGAYAEAASSAPVFSPLLGAELRIPGGSEAALELEPSFEHGVLALGPGISLDDVPIGAGEIGVLEPGRASAIVSAEQGDGIAILLGGVPHPEEFVMFWNFVGRDHAAVERARAAWMAERDAPEDARPQFGVVDDGSGTTLPSPRIPTVELLPRGRARRR
ncbi:MAG: pirin family protein [Actinomycetota bacterium]